MGTTIKLLGALEPRSGWQATHCSIAKALDVLSTRSAFLILREAFYGTERFDDFTTRVGVSDPVASARLRELVEVGLLTREPYKEEGQRTRSAYKLTPMGADLMPALTALMQWGDRWLSEDGGRVELRHRGCGARVEAELRCAEGHRVELDGLDLGRKRPDRGDPARRAGDHV